MPAIKIRLKRYAQVPQVFNFASIRFHGVMRCALASALVAAFVSLSPLATHAGGPKHLAGVSYFDSSVLGQPVHWPGGQVNFYVDQGALSSTVNNAQATALVDTAAALWSAVATAGVTLADKGPLNEDVSGTNIVASSGVIAAPTDVTAAATGYPVGVIFDADGTVIDAIFGAGASDPTSCQIDGVRSWIDVFNTDATISHAVILLNGRCATNAAMLEMMSFQLERAFGSILGLDYSQVNPNAQSSGDTSQLLGWPVMQPVSGTCGATGGKCIPDPDSLRYDDMAALGRIYPVTAANLASFAGKQITLANTVSITGTISFRAGTGMQGVNVVARPVDSSGNVLYQYTVTAVSGVYFNGNHGNPVTGWEDTSGNRLDQWGSNDSSLQGYFDLSGIPLPPGMTTADYQVSFEAINPLYILTNSVGPYVDGQPAPSGTLATITLPGLAAGSAQTVDVSVSDSAAGGNSTAIGSENAPRSLPTSGMWNGRLSQVGQTDWFTFPVRGGRTFTIVTQALDEQGFPTGDKAIPAIGVWDGFDAAGTTAVGAVPGLNGLATGESWLQVTATGSEVVRIGIADERGDGRPDYAYKGWVLYADTVTPERLPASGGAIVIHGMGFHICDTVLVGGQQAIVTSISPNEITAIAPAVASGVTGSVDVEVDDQPVFYASAVIAGGVSYDAGTGDALTLISAPTGTVPMDVPVPFTVKALKSDLTPAGGVTVTYTVTSGPATLSCGQTSCSVTTGGDGMATMSVTPTGTGTAIVTATLVNGSSLQTEFAGGTVPTLTALTRQLSVAAGATVPWPVQALVLSSSGQPASGQNVKWQNTGSGIAALTGTSVVTGADGTATETLTVGPLSAGQTGSITACLNGTSQCVTFTAFGARPEYAALAAVSGTEQSLAVGGTPSQVVLRLLDMNGNAMAGGTVSLYQTLYAWSPACPAHGVCARAELLAAEASTATSALDGSVIFNPKSLAGVATNLSALAVTGNTAAVAIAVEEHP
jgi:hypothetical protein